jgi:phospholipase A1
MMRWFFTLIFVFSTQVLADSGSGPLLDQKPAREIGTEQTSEQNLEKMRKEEESLLQRHHPFYFAYGNPTTKAQLSFKVPIVEDIPLYFGYSQLIFWELTENSKPFRDMTYNPELFYRFNLEDGSYILKSIDVGLWNHNSNGKRDLDSRSYNKSYLRFNAAYEFDKWVIRASAQLAALYDFDATNRDIQDYISPVSFSVAIAQLFDGTWVDKSEFSIQASPGGKFANHWEKGGYQFAYSFRLGGLKVVPAFYLQYYTGYAESLLNYDRNEQESRGGVIF